MEGKIVVIVGQQRSGTTVAARTIAAAGGYEDVGEIFVHSGTRQETNFFHYRLTRLTTDPNLSIPTEENQRNLWTGYMNHLRAQTGSSRVLMDIKYNLFHHLNDFYVDPADRPLLLNFLIEQNAHFVHVVREGYVQQAVSNILAERRGIWHSTQADTSGVELPIDISPDYLLHKMRQSRGRVVRWSRILSHVPNVVRLDYPNFIDRDRFSESAISALGEIVPSDALRGTELALKKVSPPVSEIVANKEQLLEAVRGTDFEQEAVTELDR